MSSPVPPRRRWFRYSVSVLLGVVAICAVGALLYRRPTLSPVDSLIADRLARTSLRGAAKTEIEKKLGTPDYLLDGDNEWHYLQQDTSRLGIMELSQILILRFENGKVVYAIATD